MRTEGIGMKNPFCKKIVISKHYKLLRAISLIWFLSVSGCQKNIYLPLQYPTKTSFNERLATKSQPAKFYVCGNCSHPCQKITNRWSGVSKKNFKGEK